jgi:DNA protecting protein DprA
MFMLLDTSVATRRDVLAPSPSTTLVPGWGSVHTQGDTALLATPSVAIIGSRRATDEGRALASALATQLAEHRIVVVSGLAAGIDAAAHEAAMHAAGRTIAVIGTSLDQAYPPKHAALQARIAREHLVVSPFAVGTPMAGWHFPRRNCLMARIAMATVLVEAAPKSGTRHQVDACISLGRPLVVHAALLGRGIDWLDVAHSRGQLQVWREPGEALRLLLQPLAERRASHA